MIRSIYRKVLPLGVRLRLRNALAAGGAQPGDAADFDRYAVARQYLRGEGIEIGALHQPLRVPPAARVRYVDRLPVRELRAQYPELNEVELVEPDFIADGELLETVGDASQDFVIANHFIEHCQNPLLALSNMLRVLRAGGVLYLTIPDKRYTFDADRPVTTVEHVLKDYEEGPSWSRRGHFEEWVRLVNKVEDGRGAAERVEELLGMDYSIHFHVWTQAEMFELLQALRSRLGGGFDTELFLKNADECVFVLRKDDPAAPPAPSAATHHA
jgi:SAM-dependent methyltransferase